jgi:hypothetical protein
MKTGAVVGGLVVLSCAAWACSSSNGDLGFPDGDASLTDASLSSDVVSDDDVTESDASPPVDAVAPSDGSSKDGAAGDAGGDANDGSPPSDSGADVDAGPCVAVDWATELATTDKTTHLEGTTAVDPSGGVHTSCTQLGAGLRYAHRAPDGGWSVEQAPFTGAPNYNALALGPDGKIHLAYRDTATVSLAVRYAVRDTNGTWTPGVIFAGENPVYPSIVASASGRIHVAFQPGDGKTVGYEYKDPGGAWTAIERFDTGVLADNVTLDVDGAGGLYVAYTDAFTRSIKYAHRAAQGAWAIEVVEAAGNGGTGGPRSLVVDAGGVVHLAYATSAGLVYARRANGAWTKEAADATAGRGCEAALALDASGAVEIAYKHCTQSGVWFARRDASGTWSTKLLDATGVYLGPATLATDPSYGVHAVWKNGDANLVYGHARVCP